MAKRSAGAASWTGTAGGDWGSATDWSTGSVPDGPAADVTIAAPGDYVVTIGGTEAFDAATLTIGSEATLSLAGTLDLSVLDGGFVAVDPGGRLEIANTPAGGILNDGLVETTGRSALGDLAGRGVLVIDADSALDLTGADGERVDFAGPDATLLIQAPSLFGAVIGGFEQSDTLALVGVQGSSVAVAGNVVTVLSGAAATAATLLLDADYAPGTFSLVQSGNTALISETGLTYSLEGPTWDVATVTYSFATSSYADDAARGDSFSAFVTASTDQVLFEQALSAWSSITKLVFAEVPDTTNPAQAADIRIGWADFEASGAGSEVGETDFNDAGGTFDSDVVVRLEDPAQDPVTDSNGVPIYSDTTSDQFSIALHELGHAIGLDHTADQDAIMYPVATALNRQLDASDIAAAQALYPAGIACFAAGTALRTSGGPVPVERLRPGHQVWSALRQAWVPVIWTGHRRIACRHNPTLTPVRVRAAAFGPGRPARDLVLSPDHAIAWRGALIPARLLVDGVAVQRLDAAAVTYWHVEVPGHDVLLAEGLPVESYLDSGNRAAFDEAAGHQALFPNFPARRWHETCLPLRLCGPTLGQARALLRARTAPGIRATATCRWFLLHRGTYDFPGVTGLLDGRRVTDHAVVTGRAAVLELPVAAPPPVELRSLAPDCADRAIRREGSKPPGSQGFPRPPAFAGSRAKP